MSKLHCLYTILLNYLFSLSTDDGYIYEEYKIHKTMSLEKVKILQKQHKIFMGFIL